jgi:aminoglycoside phosphotransferase (APT) family kinase protein
LAQVPGLAGGQAPLHLARLGGGTVNEVFHVVSPEGAFVLRLDGPSWRRPGVDRARELSLHTVAAGAGLAPAIVAALPAQQGLLVTEYQSGRTWRPDDYREVAALRRLGERLAMLHSLPAPAMAPFDPLQVGEAYARLVAPGRIAPVAAVMQRLATLCKCLNDRSGPACVVHGDLWEGNLLEGARLWLLDWEYAQVTDPLMDVAGLLAYYPEAARHSEDLMAAAGIATDMRRGLADRVDIYRILAWLWRSARGETVAAP